MNMPQTICPSTQLPAVTPQPPTPPPCWCPSFWILSISGPLSWVFSANNSPDRPFSPPIDLGSFFGPLLFYFDFFFICHPLPTALLPPPVKVINLSYCDTPLENCPFSARFLFDILLTPPLPPTSIPFSVFKFFYIFPTSFF